MEIPFLLDEQLADLGVRKYISWHPDLAPHMILISPTGGGKTYAAKLMLAKANLCISDLEITLLDFKGDTDFSFLEGRGKRFYRYTDCQQGMTSFFEAFQRRQSREDSSRNMRLLYFDEFPSFYNSFSDKKALEVEKQRMANLLMLGRSYKTFVVLACQRADMSHFISGARENICFVLSLSNISKESRAMFFQGFESDMKHDRQRGTGYLLINGAELHSVRVPTISHMDKVQANILEAVNRESKVRP